MLFILSFFLFVLYVVLLLTNPGLRWVGWGFAAFYFGFLIMFGEVLRFTFDLSDGSKAFFLFLAIVYAASPIILGEIFARIFGRRKPAIS